mgnify:CR=1 FL=1
MQAQVKYESEIKTAVLGDRTITVKNVTPIYPPQERDKRSREVERRLFDVFVKSVSYTHLTLPTNSLV